MGNEFEKAVKRFSEAKDVLEKFEKSEEAVAFMKGSGEHIYCAGVQIRLGMGIYGRYHRTEFG